MDIEPESIEIAYENSLFEIEEPVKFDQKSWITSADLYNQGTESLIAGGVRGGLQLFQNTNTGNQGGDNSSISVNIYPNPIFDLSGLSIKSNQDVTVELISLLGQRMLEPFKVKKFLTTVLDVGSMNVGAYILWYKNDSGEASSQLFMIMR